MKQDDVLRKCIVTGVVQEKEKMLRFTVLPDMSVVPDFKKKLPGRGIYVANSQSVLKQAVEKNMFSKAAKKKVLVSAGLSETVDRLLRKKALDAVSLARKGGFLVTGMEKVAEALKGRKVAFLIEASDAGEDGARKISALANGLEVFRVFKVEELDTALNKTNTVHAALLKGEMAKMVYSEFNKLTDFLNS